jgi:hypothetical protein
MFEELSEAVEDLSEDYHDDYIFKRYLQEKWNQVVENATQQAPGQTPAVAADA